MLKVALIANFFINKNVMTSGQWDVASGRVPIKRVWNPLLAFMWLIFQTLFFILTIYSQNDLLILTETIAYVCIIILNIFSFIWTVVKQKEKNGKYMIKKTLMPIVIATVGILIIGVISYFITEITSKKYFNRHLSETKQDLDSVLEKMNEINSKLN